MIKNYKDYSVLGHLDLISRYDENGPYPFEKIKPMIQEILEIVNQYLKSSIWFKRFTTIKRYFKAL